MVGQTLIDDDDFYIPDANQLITEDDTPVDNFASAKQQRLLVSSLYSCLQDRTFLAESNVGIYYTDLQPAIVPDIFLSLDVEVPEKWWEKQNRCYMVWRFGKPPEVVMEIVSNKVGNELGEKLEIYQHMRASYYVVYDPTNQLSDRALRIFELRGRRYFETTETWLEQVGLGLTLWEGEFEARQDTWLRWCYQDGSILPTGDERAQQAEQRATQAEQLLTQERLEKEQAMQRAQQLAERLRAMGIDPESL
jgi:Uma2 family endonuclease